jgi:hypothetical protein
MRRDTARAVRLHSFEEKVAMSVNDLLRGELKVVNIGLTSFKKTLEENRTPVAHVDWRPPIDIDAKALAVLRAHKADIDAANEIAAKIILNGKPFLVGLEKALDVVPAMKKNLILHAGPPVTWERMCGPMRGAVIGAILYEGLATSAEEAEQLAASDKITYSPCHEHQAVGPMAGIVSASMPVFVIRNEEYGNAAYATMNEGLGQVLRYGAYDQAVVQRLQWMEQVLYTVLRTAVARIGKVDLKNIIAQALHMGD